jgi:hypothetical protein
MTLNGNKAVWGIHALHSTAWGRTQGSDVRGIFKDDILVHLLDALFVSSYRVSLLQGGIPCCVLWFIEARYNIRPQQSNLRSYHAQIVPFPYPSGSYHIRQFPSLGRFVRLSFRAHDQ